MLNNPFPGAREGVGSLTFRSFLTLVYPFAENKGNTKTNGRKRDMKENIRKNKKEK